MKRLIAALLLSIPISSFAVSELACLSENIYREARGESFVGQIAVGVVTLNRVKSSKFPKTICKVVFQPHQFSWTTKFDNVYRAQPIHKTIAKNLMSGSYSMPGFVALYYHKVTLKPVWAASLVKIKVIQNHIFYRE